MKVLIAIPCNNYVELECIDSIFKTINRIKEWCEFDVKFYSGYSCEQARNKAIKDLINSDYDYIWFIDSDIKFESDTFEKLLLSNCDICTGIYFLKQFGEKEAVIMRIENGKTLFYKENEIPENEIFQIDACGFGCILIKREVCEHIYNHENGYPFVYQFEPEIISEDLWFCNCAVELGYKIMCNSDVKCGHIWKICFG